MIDITLIKYCINNVKESKIVIGISHLFRNIYLETLRAFNFDTVSGSIQNLDLFGVLWIPRRITFQTCLKEKRSPLPRWWWRLLMPRRMPA